MNVRNARPTSTDLAYCVKAAWLLALARIEFQCFEIDRLMAGIGTTGAEATSMELGNHVDLPKMRWALSAVGARLPWRSDCFMQVLAARRWLAKTQVAYVVKFGILSESPAKLAAHVWLEADGVAITGGPVSDIAPFSDACHGKA